MLKNTASQKVTLLAIDTAANTPKTGDAANITAYVSKDDGTVTVLTDTSATELDATNAPGLYSFDLSQAETNGDKLLFSAKSSTSGIKIVPQLIYTHPTGGIASPTNITAITGNITGNLSGSVGSVTGAVGSVTGNVSGNVAGSVGSVSGAVGSVTGSVGSISTGGIAAASFAAGAINAAAIATDAIGSDEISAAAVTKIRSGLVQEIWQEDTSVLVTYGATSAGYYLANGYEHVSTMVVDLAAAHGAGSWATATGFSTHSAADVWAVATRTITGGTIGTYTGNTPQTGDAFAYLGTNVGLLGANLTAADDAVISAIAALNNLSQANVRTAVGLATANLDTQLADLPTVAELEARTLVAASYGTAANQSTIIGYIDTEVAAILAAVDTEVAAIKAKTDQLTFTVANQVDANTLTIVGTADDAVLSAIAALNNLSAAQVNTECDTALTDAGVTTARMAALADWIDGGRLDLLLDAILDDTGTAGVALSAAICNKVADHVRRRTQANVEASSDGDTLSVGSHYGSIQQVQESNLVDNPGKITIYKTDGVTELGQKTVTSDPLGEPLTGVS